MHSPEEITDTMHVFTLAGGPWSCSQMFGLVIGVLSFSDGTLVLASGEVRFPSSRRGNEPGPPGSAPNGVRFST